jgi:glycerol-3-phosphate dehydrogenase
VVEQIDLLVVGGGINGSGVARDAAGRGLTVMLVEKDDLAAHTSSASSKLIHGGLRYLEQFEFRLVRESLTERERLLRAAPHIVRPLKFVFPLTRSARPSWMVRAGLFLYDHLGGRKILPASRSVRLDRDPLGEGLASGISRGFSYWDCQVQDSRLVVLNAMDAAERGAIVQTRTELLAAHREDQRWIATLGEPNGEKQIAARALVNAGGPWAGQLFERIAGVKPRHGVRLVKGSHIVLPRVYPGEHAFLLQNDDGRVVFAIPFEGSFTLVGTTDVTWLAPPPAPAVTEEEIDYLLAVAARYFTAKALREDVVWRFSGLRSLVDDGASDPSQVTRDYALDLDQAGAPLLSVIGGKITTYRRLAEQALDRLARVFPSASGRWTGRAVLPGGDVPDLDMHRYARNLAGTYPTLPTELIERLARTYGTRSERLLGDARSIAGLGEHFGAGLYAREVDYLVAHEWARTAEDVLFRRTKLGLNVETGSADRLAEYLARPA